MPDNIGAEFAEELEGARKGLEKIRKEVAFLNSAEGQRASRDLRRAKLQAKEHQAKVDSQAEVAEAREQLRHVHTKEIRENLRLQRHAKK